MSHYLKAQQRKIDATVGTAGKNAMPTPKAALARRFARGTKPRGKSTAD